MSEFGGTEPFIVSNSEFAPSILNRYVSRLAFPHLLSYDIIARCAINRKAKGPDWHAKMRALDR